MISVIVPIYNAEKYLKKCIESITKQSYKNIQIILVNDGSTDGSGSICDFYSKKDKRIKVVHLENNGVSNARNVGIENSGGEYIHFVDADDTIEMDLIEKLFNSITKYKTDISICGYRKIIVEKNKITKTTIPFYNGPINLFLKDIDYLISNALLQGPCGKLFKSEIVKENNIKFPLGLSFGEDTIFVYKYLLKAESVSTVEGCFYNYFNHNSESLSTIIREDKIYIYLSLYDLLFELLQVNKVKQSESIVSKLFCHSFISCLGYFYSNFPNRDVRLSQINDLLNNEKVTDHFRKYKNNNKQVIFLRYLIFKKHVKVIDLCFLLKNCMKLILEKLIK